MSQQNEKIQLVQEIIVNLKTSYEKHLKDREESHISYLEKVVKELGRIKEMELLSDKDNKTISFLRAYYSDKRSDLDDLSTRHREETDEARNLATDTLTDLDIDLSKLQKIFKDNYFVVGNYSSRTEDIAKPISTDMDLVSSSLRLGPGGSYAIAIPSQQWIVKQVSAGEMINELNFKIKAPVTESETPDPKEILMYESINSFTLTPILGKSKMFGRKSLLVLESPYPPVFLVIPSDKAYPPLFIEQSLQQNFLVFLNQMLFGRLKDISLHHDGKSLRAEFELEVSDVLVNGTMESLVKVIIKIHAFRGQKKDYFLVIRYLDIAGKRETLDIDKELISFVRSFHPIEAKSTETEETEKILEKKHSEFLSDRGGEIFWQQFSVVVLKLQEMDLDDTNAISRLNDPFKIRKIVELILPFEKLAQEVQYIRTEYTTMIWDEIEWNNFWASLHEAERGNAEDFKERLAMLVAKMATVNDQIQQVDTINYDYFHKI